MKSILKLSIGALAFSSVLAAPAHAEFSDVGTAYSKATVDRWSDDQINMFVEKANSFACVMSKSRPDLLPNAQFEVLMSEVECGLAEEVLNGSGASNKDTLSSSVMKTSRASATSAQEGQFWFNSTSDMKFVGNINIKQDSIDLPPYGEWSLSYYNNAFQDDAAGKDGDEFTALTTPISGFVDITSATAASGNGIVVSSYEVSNMTRKASICPGGCNQNEVMSSSIQYFGGSVANTRILGRIVGTNDRGNAVDLMTAATTNATHIYKRVFAGGGAQPSSGSEMCTKRDSTWKTVHRYGVYNKSTGNKVSLNGGFGFDYTDGATASRGFLSPNGAFFDNPNTAFTLAAPTKSVTAQTEAATPYTLSWAPGKLSQRVLETETLPVDPDGDSVNNITYFKKWINDGSQAEVRIVKDGATFKATYHNLSTGTAIPNPFFGNKATVRKVAASGTHGIDNHKWMGWMYSPEKRTKVFWDGSATIKFYNEKNASADATLLAGSAAGQYTKLLGTQNASNSLASALPITASAWTNTAGGFDYYNYAKSGNGVGIGTKFYFTALTPPAGKLARTLYLDVNPVGPSAGDKAVMFNFSANERKNELTPFGSTTPVSLEVNNEVRWPFKELDLVSTLANGNAGTTLYQWKFGAFGWDNSVIALKADNTVYTIDDPIVFDYVHAEAKDMNNGKVITFVKDYQNDHNPAPQLCGVPAGGARTQVIGVGAGAQTVAVTECVVDPGDFDTKVFQLRYNGNWIDGLPDMEGRASENDKNGFRVTMVNPIAGTIVTNTVGGITTNYVLKPLAVSESFLAEPTMANCDAIDFDTYAEFGWDANDLPSPTLVPLPTQLWTAQPAKSALKCTVNSGDAAQCFE